MRLQPLSLLLLSCTLAIPPALHAGELPASRFRMPRKAPARLETRRAIPNSSLLAPDCPHPDDALWSNQFGLPDLRSSAALAEDGGDLVIGGDFSIAGLVHSQNVVRWDGVEWHPFGADLPRPCSVLARIGGVLYAGCSTFNPVGVPDSIVFGFDGSHWRALGTMTHSDSNVAECKVKALASYGGELIAAGVLGRADGETLGVVSAWNGSHWHTLGSGFPTGAANALAVANGRLFIGGAFDDNTSIKQWDGIAWSNVGAGFQNGPNQASVYALISDGVNVYASGQFSQSGSLAITGLPKWDGSSWSNLGTGIAHVSQALGWMDGKIVASQGGMWNGSSWVPLGTGLSSEPEVLFEWNSKLIAGNVWVGSVPGERPATTDGVSWTALQAPWVPGQMAGVYGQTVAAVNWRGQLVVAAFDGNPVAAQTQYMSTSGVTTWDGSGWNSVGTPTSPGQGVCSSLCVWNDSLVAGMYFSSISGVNCHHLARWDGTSWKSIGQGVIGGQGWVYSVAAAGDALYAFGLFTKSGTTVVNGAARWDGNAWQPMGSGFPMDIYGDMIGYPLGSVVWGTDVVVIGEFDSLSGVTVSNIARWDGSAWHPLGAGLDDEGQALAVFEGDLIAGGVFTHAGGVAAPGVARWNGTDWSPLGDNAVMVSALRVVNEKLFAGGTFRCPDAEQVNGIAIWDGTTWQLTGSGFDRPYISFIEPWNGDLYAGGGFGWANGHAANGVARWSGLSSVGVPRASAAPELALRSPVPNPSAGGFDLSFALPAPGYARLAVFDLEGRRVATLRQGTLAAGSYRARWNGADDRGAAARSGVYFARLETAQGSKRVRMVLTR